MKKTKSIVFDDFVQIPSPIMLIITGLVLYGPSYMIWYNLPKPSKSKWILHQKRMLPDWSCSCNFSLTLETLTHLPSSEAPPQPFVQQKVVEESGNKAMIAVHIVIV